MILKIIFLGLLSIPVGNLLLFLLQDVNKDIEAKPSLARRDQERSATTSYLKVAK